MHNQLDLSQAMKGLECAAYGLPREWSGDVLKNLFRSDISVSARVLQDGFLRLRSMDRLHQRRIEPTAESPNGSESEMLPSAKASMMAESNPVPAPIDRIARRLAATTARIVEKSPYQFIQDYETSNDMTDAQLIKRTGTGHDVFYAIKGERRWTRQRQYALLSRVVGCREEDLYPNIEPRPRWARRLRLIRQSE